MKWSIQILMVLIGLALPRASLGNHREKRSYNYIWLNTEKAHTWGLLWIVPFQLFVPSFDIFGKEEADKEAKDQLENMYIQPQYSVEIMQLQSIFHYLQVLSVVCQEQFICRLSSEEDKYSPISMVFLKELKQNRGPIERSESSLMYRYIRALKLGMTNSEHKCLDVYEHCDLDLNQILSSPLLKAWHFATENMRIDI